MKESEYIDATNLAKIRCAKTIIRDTLDMNDVEKNFRLRALQALSEWEAMLEQNAKLLTE